MKGPGAPSDHRAADGLMKVPGSPIDIWVADGLQTTPECLTPELLEAYQLNCIRELIRYLKEHSGYYKEKLADYQPEDIRTMADFHRLPTTDESDLTGQEWRFQCVNSSCVQRIVTVPTTGTTGRQKRIGFTAADLGRALAFAPYGFRVMSEPGDHIVVMMSGESDGSIGENIRRGVEPFGMRVSVYGPVLDLTDAAGFLCRERPDVIVGIPYQMAALAGYMKTYGMEYAVKSVLLSADDVSEAVCRRLRRLWNCQTFRHYGMTELCMFGAVECHRHDGYHIRALDQYFEVIHPDKEGYGEIAVTTFRHQGMPLLRYRTGDIGKITGYKCRCGSVLPRISDIRGRKSNCVVFSGGKLFLREVQEVLYEDDRVIDFDCFVKESIFRIVIYTLPEAEWNEKDTAVFRKKLSYHPAMQGISLQIDMKIMQTLKIKNITKKRIEKI